MYRREPRTTPASRTLWVGALTVFRVRLDEQSAVLALSTEGWVALAFEDRLYGDAMACG